LRADSGFFDDAIMKFLHGKSIAYIISARLTQPLQQAMVSQCKFWIIEPGLEIGEISYQAPRMGRGTTDRGGAPEHQDTRTSTGQDAAFICRRP
jgi:hypothetical protein